MGDLISLVNVIGSKENKGFLRSLLFPSVVFFLLASYLFDVNIFDILEPSITNTLVIFERMGNLGIGIFLIFMLFLGILCGFALLLHALRNWILELFQGYFLPHFLKTLLIRSLLRKRLGDNKSRIFEAMIPSEFLLPTRLGNILRSSELYAWEKYGIDKNSVWVRMLKVLPHEYLLDLEEKNNNLLAYLNLSLIFLVLGIMCLNVSIVKFSVPIWNLPMQATLLGIDTWSPIHYLALGMVMMFGGYFWYRGGLSAAEDVSLSFRYGLDIYRFKLLEALNIALPNNNIEEVNTWKIVSEWFKAGEYLAPIQLNYDYPHDSQKKKEDQSINVKIQEPVSIEFLKAQSRLLTPFVLGGLVGGFLAKYFTFRRKG